MKGIIYESAWKFKAEMLKLAVLTFCTPAPAIMLRGLIDGDYVSRILSLAMLISIVFFVWGLCVLDMAYKILASLDEVKYNHDQCIN